MGKKYTDNRNPVAVRFDKGQIVKIETAAKLTGLAKQDIIRLCLSIGLEKLARINYDLSSVILTATASK
jgi:hypothetical protein